MFYMYKRAYKVIEDMAMNSYIWPNEIFMYQSKPLAVKAVKEEVDDDRSQWILEKLNCLETAVKTTRAKPQLESQTEEACYIGNTGGNPYSNTYNLGWRDHSNIK